MSSRAAFDLSALKDAYDYSCFLARLDEYRHLMAYTRPGLGGRHGAHGRVQARSAAGRGFGLGRVVALHLPLIRFIADSLTYSVPLFLN